MQLVIIEKIDDIIKNKLNWKKYSNFFWYNTLILFIIAYLFYSNIIKIENENENEKDQLDIFFDDIFNKEIIKNINKVIEKEAYINLKDIECLFVEELEIRQYIDRKEGLFKTKLILSQNWLNFINKAI